MVYRVYVEKRPGLTAEADALLGDIRTLLRIESLESLRLYNRYRLQNKREEQEHPNPISTTERGRIEKRETGEECAAKSHKSSKREFPFASGTIYKQQSFVFRFADTYQFCCFAHRKVHGNL